VCDLGTSKNEEAKTSKWVVKASKKEEEEEEDNSFMYGRILMRSLPWKKKCRYVTYTD
jgi:hypothetical protein